MSRGTVLISGASIAGPTLALWLARLGLDPVVVERFPSLRVEGQNVDVRGTGREVLRRSGVEEAALAHRTGESGTAFVDDAGRTVADFPAATGEVDGATAELEILRGRLSGLLHDATRASTEYVFGDQIADLTEHPHGVEVTFASGAQRQVDLVVIAEGVRSRTRTRVFGGSPLHHLGVYCAYLTIPRTADDDDRWRWYAALGGRSVHLRPDDTGTTRAILTFLSDTRGLDDLDAAAQVQVLTGVFAGAGWETDRVLAGLRASLDGPGAEPFYFEDLAQARPATWASGRTVLLGDAAWCASPMSGMGTTLSLTGAYVLAEEIARVTRDSRIGDHREAFARYEARMRPFVAKAQKLPPGTPWVANPRSTRHRRLLWAGMRAASSRAGRAAGSVLGGLVSPPADAFTLSGPTTEASSS